MHSIRVQLLSFILALLLLLLLLLNTFPLTTSRDIVFEEKRNSLSSQGSVLASSLSNLDRMTADGVSEVIRILDLSGFSRIIVTDSAATVLYDSSGPAGVTSTQTELLQALENKLVFNSAFVDGAFRSVYTMPVYDGPNKLGALYLSEHDNQRAAIIISIQTRIRSYSIIIATLALLISGIITTLLLSRIKDMVHSMRVVASGDYSHRLVTRGKDELTELGNEFNLLTQRLDENERQRRRFVSDASHELKTPLASIRLLSDSIVQNENMDSETVREFVTDIGNEAERLQRTTEKLLDLSRLDDDVQIVPEPVDLKQVSVDALVLLRPLADEQKVRLKCELEDGCVIMANVDDAFHIIFNLMENAIKYNVPEGSVLLKLNGDEDNVYLAVSDTGIGIPEEDRLNIFSRFYRVDKARSREAGGSGLGLSIVHDAVLAHGGTIAVGQNKPQGSRFIVTFPRPTSEETGI